MNWLLGKGVGCVSSLMQHVNHVNVEIMCVIKSSMKNSWIWFCHKITHHQTRLKKINEWKLLLFFFSNFCRKFLQQTRVIRIRNLSSLKLLINWRAFEPWVVTHSQRWSTHFILAFWTRNWMFHNYKLTLVIKGQDTLSQVYSDRRNWGMRYFCRQSCFRHARKNSLIFNFFSLFFWQTEERYFSRVNVIIWMTELQQSELLSV